MRLRTAAERDAQLRALATAISQSNGPTALIGDLNVTPWSPHFTSLTDATGLRDARLGFGLNATWPSNLPWFCRIPIDHCLVSSDVSIESFEVGDPIGGDHLPIIVRFGITTDS